MDLIRDNVVYFAGIDFPGSGSATSSSVREDSGTFNISVSPANDPTHILAQNQSLELPENAYTLIALVGTMDQAQLVRIVTDRSAVEIARGTLPEPGKLIDALRADDNLPPLPMH